MTKVDVLVGRHTYAGLFMVTLATLMHEILLTRIFSVTMWYHYAFLAISVALFGMTVGAILVYVFPGYFSRDRTNRHLALSAWLFGVSIVFSFLTYVSIPFVTARSLVTVFSLALMYVIISIPFVFSGICVSLALTRFPRRVSRLYAADLAGAACGCLFVIYTLRLTDGPGAVIVASVLGCVSAACFAAGESAGNLRRATLISSLVLALFVIAHTVLATAQFPPLRLIWVKGQLEGRALYEKWNSFSRIRVTGDPNTPSEPFGWGLSSVYPSDKKVRQLDLNIDATAGTVLTARDNRASSLEHLRYDVTNLAHYIRYDANVLVIGSGGGRDILSALAFGQKSVVAVEINQDIIAAVNRRFGDFTGHLDADPRVAFVNDEGRSYIARQRARFDIIQASLIDTWAATAAGAFVLSENSLYTVDAWKLFLERLTPTGVLTFSRWYFRDRPDEMYRLTSLAAASLRQLGIENPQGHIVIVRHMRPRRTADVPNGIGTILVSRQPFSEEDLNTIENTTRKLQFDVMLSPRASPDATFATLAAGRDLEAFWAKFPLNIAPPTDDSPFFFHMLRLRDILERAMWERGANAKNSEAVFVLGVLLLVVIGLTTACIIVPLILTTKKGALKDAGPLFIFFASIGLGFMFVEISQMQRLIIFLGHPTYGLSVVLFALLLSSGLGSYLTQRVGHQGLTAAAIVRLGLLLCVLAVFGRLTPYAISVFQSATTIVRILVAVITLFPIGILMGMAFPLGMKIASARFASLMPWLWGVNGATSVCASVLAVAIALHASISASFWAGFGCYAIALAAFALANQPGRTSVSLPEVFPGEDQQISEVSANVG